MDDPCFPFDLYLLHPPYKSFKDRSEHTYCSWYHHHLYVALLFQFSGKAHVRVSVFVFFDFYTVLNRDGKILFFRLLLLCISFSRTDFSLNIYYLVVWWNFNFLQNSQWIIFSTQSCLIVYYFFSSFLHSFIMWLIVFSLSSHKLHSAFCCVLSIFGLT